MAASWTRRITRKHRMVRIDYLGGMHKSLAAALGLACVAPGQRVLRVSQPAVSGQACSIALLHPSTLAGALFVSLASNHTNGQPSVIAVPGFTVAGLLRLDGATLFVADGGTLAPGGQSDIWSGMIPINASLIGATWDMQTADLDASGTTFTLSDNRLAMRVAAMPPTNMVPVPPGVFTMGSGAFVAQLPQTANELTPHTVVITRPFWIGKYEVTQAEFQSVMGSNPSFNVGPNLPVELVSHALATLYCQALTTAETSANRVPTGYEYRLPTEAEWEYCCRAGTTSEWSTGGSISCAQANHFDSNANTYCVSGWLGGMPATVGSYAPNAWGIHDMHGNVAELCKDAWDGTSGYGPGLAVDPLGTTGALHVLRGGCWELGPLWLRSAARRPTVPGFNGLSDGFRVVLAPIL